MYECVGLSKKNIIYFKELNRNRNKFNLLNKDFFELYNKFNFAQQIFLKRKVKLLKINNKFIGYIWWEIDDRSICNVNAMSVYAGFDNSRSHVAAYNYLINTLRKNNIIKYRCESNEYNFNVLEKLGFIKKEGTLVLYFDINDSLPVITKDEFEFEILKRDRDEQKRCDIQNAIFEDDNRIPLTLEDIYFDQMQEYYYDKGAVFLKKNGQYIGYGQVIIEDNVPLIVNFGILRKYRGNGYSKALLSYLLRIIKFNNWGNVKIKVKSTNTVALNLYKTLGFKIKSEIYNWQKTR